MKLINTPLYLMLSLALLPLLVKDAQACSCNEYGTPPCAAYWRADAVFSGIIIDIKKPSHQPSGDLPKALLHFVIEESFRGVESPELDVATLSGTSCDIPFNKGERWLIYAYRDKSSGKLEIYPCTRITLLANADEDLKYIRGLKQNKPEQSILGKLLRNKYIPLTEVKVAIEGNGHKSETVTGKEGEFSLAIPQSGDYVFRAYVPFAASMLAYTENENIEVRSTDNLTTIEYKIKVPEGQCIYKEFDLFKVDLHATAEVSGRVLDKSGRPFSPAGYLYLVNAEDEGDSTFKEIGSNGEFKFEGVAVGRYYLVVNPYDKPPGEGDAPSLRTYYPGVRNPSNATLVTVVEGAKIEDIVFRLSAPLKERVVSGKVVWADGRIAKDAFVSLYGGEKMEYIRMVKTDSQGNFMMKIYGDFSYEIKAEKMGETRGYGEKVKIPPTNKLQPFRLVIQPE